MWRNRIQLLLATPAVFIHFKFYSTFSWIASFMAFKNAKKCLNLLFPSNYQLFLHQFIKFRSSQMSSALCGSGPAIHCYKYLIFSPAISLFSFLKMLSYSDSTRSGSVETVCLDYLRRTWRAGGSWAGPVCPAAGSPSGFVPFSARRPATG